MKKYLVLALCISGAILVSAGAVCFTLVYSFADLLEDGLLFFALAIIVCGIVFIIKGLVMGFKDKDYKESKNE